MREALGLLKPSLVCVFSTSYRVRSCARTCVCGCTEAIALYFVTLHKHFTNPFSAAAVVPELSSHALERALGGKVACNVNSTVVY